MSLRRSARIASKYGAMYSNVPSIKSQKRIQAESKKSMEAMLKSRSSTNAIEFYIQDYDVHFTNPTGWAAKRYTPQTIPGQTYDRVFVKITQEDHSGYCSDAEDMYETEIVLIMYFHRLDGETPLKDMIPTKLTWSHRSDHHYWCNAQDRYSIISVTSIVAPPQDVCNCDECLSGDNGW